jgi:hypothetical protein
VRRGPRARSDCQMPQRMSAPAVLSDCFGAGALSPKGQEPSLPIGGEGEIRTHEALADPPVFKTGAINRSATSPVRAQLLAWV